MGANESDIFTVESHEIQPRPGSQRPSLRSASLADVPDHSQMSGRHALGWPKSGHGHVATD